ncbi:hypothetical protein [Prauserella muralis]|uniref:Uncharacterized protein n=1 Tax=Prauserella muralis TaxID=588067 RepID=A0A2V4AKQ5_9PSEU|nr:hypothetical protein [Prauserella muralis]PXY20878.1 hypothetical protein BAY60_25580 [Prauserella muralis]TWE29918.1 hypothetical protein FHX69_2611 [Prauserella muralis]
MDLAAIDALIENAEMPTASVDLCLRGDLQAKWEDLERQLKAEVSTGRSSLAGTGTGKAEELARQIRELETEMQSSVLTMTLRALPRTEWRELEAKHPPRKDNDADRLYGFNTDTIFDEALAPSLVSPELDAARLAKIVDRLTSGQFERLALAMLDLNRQASDVPFSQAASLVTKASDATSRRLSGSASRTSGSRAGSRGK